MKHIGKRVKFYIACDWTNNLNFFYYTRGCGYSANGKKDWKYKKMQEIMAKAKSMGAFD